MRRRSAVAVALVALGALVAATPAVAVSDSFGVEVEVAEGLGDTYVAFASITDLADGEVLAAPRFELAPGEVATATTVVEDADGAVELRLSVRAFPATARMTFVAVREGVVTHRQQAEVSFAPPRDGESRHEERDGG